MGGKSTHIFFFSLCATHTRYDLRSPPKSCPAMCSLQLPELQQGLREVPGAAQPGGPQPGQLQRKRNLTPRAPPTAHPNTRCVFGCWCCSSGWFFTWLLLFLVLLEFVVALTTVTVVIIAIAVANAAIVTLTIVAFIVVASAVAAAVAAVSAPRPGCSVHPLPHSPQSLMGSMSNMASSPWCEGPESCDPSWK